MTKGKEPEISERKIEKFLPYLLKQYAVRSRV